ncbi:MAG: hypothetical protein AB1330_11690 [Bacillota bacterium]
MKKLVLVIILGAVIVAAPLFFQKEDDIRGSGRRAFFIMNVLAYAPPGYRQKTERSIEATVTFIDSRGRFAAMGHGCDCPPLGYGFLDLPAGKREADRTEFDLSYRQAALFVNCVTDNGLFGWLQKPVPGFPAAAGEPKEGVGAVFISEKVGAKPRIVPAALVCMSFPGESEGWYVVTREPVLLPGASGSPVVQVKRGRLCLIGAIRETIGSGLGLPGYVAEITSADKLLEEVNAF